MLNALANTWKSERIAAGAAFANDFRTATSLAMLAWPLPLCAASACDTFDPSAISCEQFFAEPNDYDELEEEEDDDEEDDAVAEDEAEEELVVVEPPVVVVAVVVVVWLADLLLPPQPAAATARMTIGTMAKMRFMLELPRVGVESELTGSARRKPAWQDARRGGS